MKKIFVYDPTKCYAVLLKRKYKKDYHFFCYSKLESFEDNTSIPKDFYGAFFNITCKADLKSLSILKSRPSKIFYCTENYDLMSFLNKQKGVLKIDLNLTKSEILNTIESNL